MRSAPRKRFETSSDDGETTYKISLQIAKIDSSTGEIAGTFDSEQPSDTDLGAKEAEEVKVRGLFYARVEPANI